MEKSLREEIRLEFLKDIENKATLIKKQKNDFTDFRKEINMEL
jgi:hypothetical protein